MHLYDSHCHLSLTSEKLNVPEEEIISRALENNISTLVNICTSFEDYPAVLKTSEANTNVYATFGIHPHSADKYQNITASEIIKTINNHEKIVAIGECGLDLYYENSALDSQLNVFEEHIKAAKISNLPLVIHSRSADRETVKTLEKYKNAESCFLMHCYTGDINFTKKLLDLDVFFSFSGILTFKNADNIVESLKIIPNNRLLVETDSPFCTPEPYRGKINEPSYVKFVAEKIGEIKNINKDELFRILNVNFRNVFRKIV